MQQLRSATWIFGVIAAWGAAGAQQQTTPAQPIPPAGGVNAEPVTPGASATPVLPGTVPEMPASGGSDAGAAAAGKQQDTSDANGASKGAVAPGGAHRRPSRKRGATKPQHKEGESAPR